MADEAQIQTSLQIRKTSPDTNVKQIDYRSQPTSFKADVDLIQGPTPGSFLVSTAGTDVDLSALTTPGLARFQNQDDTNYVQVGMWDPEGARFYPMLELLPGESYIVRLSRDIEEEFGTGDPGTASAGPSTNRLRFKAIVADCQCNVEAFGK